MARVLKREAAERDLIRQWVWYAENASVEVADRFLSAADARIATGGSPGKAVERSTAAGIWRNSSAISGGRSSLSI
jgi:plasmid stabilization system protein ParE